VVLEEEEEEEEEKKEEESRRWGKTYGAHTDQTPRVISFTTDHHPFPTAPSEKKGEDHHRCHQTTREDAWRGSAPVERGEEEEGT